MHHFNSNVIDLLRGTDDDDEGVDGGALELFFIVS